MLAANNVGIFFFCYFTVILESFPSWKYKDSSSLKAVWRVKWAPTLFNPQDIDDRAHTKVTKVSFRTSLAHLQILPMKEKNYKAGPKQAPHSRGNVSHAEY